MNLVIFSTFELVPAPHSSVHASASAGFVQRFAPNPTSIHTRSPYTPEPLDHFHGIHMPSYFSTNHINR
jgi:hypothetical protein